MEHWVQHPWPGHRKDLYGFADILAIQRNYKPRLVQVTATGVSARVQKIRNVEHLDLFLDVFDIYVEGWRKSAKTGKYVRRIVSIT